MFDNYGYRHDITLRVFSASDDSKRRYDINIRVYSTYDINTNPVIDVTPERNQRRGEPTIDAIRKALQSHLKLGTRTRWRRPPDDFKVAFVLPNSGNCAILMEKKSPFYKLMEQRMPKKNLMMALCRTLYRSAFEKEPTVLLSYLFKMINIPENVSYCLENRTPYWFYDIETREKVEVRLQTKLISNDMVALEISDGVWGSISIKDLDVFVNYFYHGHTRAKKWKLMSPKKLWTTLMLEPPTDSQEKLMVEFLTQNRTQDIVENRAVELMKSLESRYPDRIRVIDLDADRKVMLVRGKMCDWVIIDATGKTTTQKVKTYVFIDNRYLSDADVRRSGRNFANGQLRGPICIDNIHTNSSVGDQYAARALALMNDKATIAMIHTISGYIPREIRDSHKAIEFRTLTSRIEQFDSLDKDYDWKVLL